MEIWFAPAVIAGLLVLTILEGLVDRWEASSRLAQGMPDAEAESDA
jgi:hypothetical protein